MKKISMLLLVVSIAFFVSAQKNFNPEKIETIGKVKQCLELMAECKKSGNTYIFSYVYQTGLIKNKFKSFSIEDENDSFNKLYDSIIKGLNRYEKKDVYLKIPESYLLLKYRRGKVAIATCKKKAQRIKTSIKMNRKQINKLFGKS